MRRKLGDDHAISSVIGSVLLLSIFVSIFVVIQTSFVPAWESEREAEHASSLSNQVGFLKTQLDQQATGQTNVPVSANLELQPTSASTLFSRYRLAGSAGFDPGDSNFSFASPSITVQSTGGTSLLGVDETWQPIQSGAEVGPIDNLLHLRVRVPNPHSLSAGLTSTLTLTDANNNYAGKIEMLNGQDAVYVSSYSAASDTTPITNRLDDTDPDGPTFYFNLLDDNLLFGAVFAAAEKPVKLIQSDGGLPADYTVVYDRNTNSGIERVGADIGVVTQNYNFSAPSGAMTVSLRQQNYIDQTYVVEHGAVIIVQADGATMISPPAFTITRGGIQDRVAMTVPTLQGNKATLTTGAVTATLAARAGGTQIDALLPQMTYTVPTAYPGVWQSHWLELLGNAGYTAAEYDIVLTADTATLTLFGPISDPASTTNDIVLDLSQRIVDVTLAPFS